eukprot:m.25518 g.25518  ORF g.25518 m.25518 type:complete len:171 (-) comp8729_c0_seq2:1944-2456(-)
MLRRLVKGTAIAIPVLITFRDRIADVSVVHGCSMQPTLNPHAGAAVPATLDWVLIDRASARRFAFTRGDIVVLHSPVEKKLLVKRVVAMENDVVRSREPRSRYVTIPAGHIWVEGDNPSRSTDSTTHGAICAGMVTGRVAAVIWPPSRWQFISRQAPQLERVIHKSESVA